MKCKISKLNFDSKDFADQLKAFRDGFRLQNIRKRKQKSRAKLTEEKGIEKYNEEIRNQKRKSRAKLAEKGKENQSRWKHKSRNKLRVEKGPKIMREKQNAWKLKSRKRKIALDAEAVHNNEKKRKTSWD